LNEPASVSGTAALARFPLALTGILVVLFIPTFLFTPEGRLNWALEVGPGIAGMVALAIAFPRFPMSRVVYAGVFIHVVILVYGGYYSYAKAPLGFWAMETFGLGRNHYDRIGHLALGFFPALTIREVLLRVTPLKRGGWFTFLVLSVVLAVGAFWELIEWWAALVLDPAGGDKFLGSQGDIWDAQWDMFLALVGAALSLATLGRLHLKSMEKLLGRPVD
jgi:putative membrane protein